jgi:polyvinyl alcohol dehydrogenase (cytochrome)
MMTRIAFGVALLGLLAGAARLSATVGDGARWRVIGRDAKNSRNRPKEHPIRPGNVSRLAVKWVATTAGDVSGTPAVVDGAVYFGDFGRMLGKLGARSGRVIWSDLVSDYPGSRAISRVPARRWWATRSSSATSAIRNL